MSPVLFLEGKTEGELPRVAMNSAIIGCESSSSLVSAGGVVVEGNREGSWREQLCLLTPFYQTGVAPPPWLPQGLLPPVALTTDTGLCLSCEPQRSRWRGEEVEGGAAFPDTALAAAVCFRCITRWSLERRP